MVEPALDVDGNDAFKCITRTRPDQAVHATASPAQLPAVLRFPLAALTQINAPKVRKIMLEAVTEETVMQTNGWTGGWVTAVVLAASFGAAPLAAAHCDTLDGPVVAAARKALDTGNVNLVLVWVQEKDEAAIRSTFERARRVRASGGEARDLADLYFFENLVRLHRAGEGADYTGLKPAGRIEPPVAAADKAIQSGRLDELARMISERTEQGLHEHFAQVLAKRKYAPNDVEAGRAYSKAYVEFVHYAERLHDAAATMAPDAAAPGRAHMH